MVRDKHTVPHIQALSIEPFVELVQKRIIVLQSFPGEIRKVRMVHIIRSHTVHSRS